MITVECITASAAVVITVGFIAVADVHCCYFTFVTAAVVDSYWYCICALIRIQYYNASDSDCCC